MIKEQVTIQSLLDEQADEVTGLKVTTNVDVDEALSLLMDAFIDQSSKAGVSIAEFKESLLMAIYVYQIQNKN